MIISAQICSRQRFVVVHHCVTVAFLTSFSVCGIFGIPFRPGGLSHCCVKVFSVKYYIPFLEYVCAFVIPFESSGVITESHAKEKFTCNQLANGCVQMGVFLLVDVED